MQSAREDEMAHWLEQHDIPSVSKFTAALVEANVEKDALESLIGQFSVPVLHAVLTRIVAAADAEKLSQIASAIIGVIGTLVGTFCGYHIRHALAKLRGRICPTSPWPWLKISSRSRVAC